MSSKKRKQARGIELLYQDRFFIVISKPAGILSFPKEIPGEKDVIAILSWLYPFSLFPVHRLDRDCSGVMLFAKTKEAQRRFREIFAKHTIQRDYLAVVEGHFPEKKGTWQNFLQEQANLSVRVVASQDRARWAITHYEVIHETERKSYLHLRLDTGRKHQIRVHCAHYGCPIVGDKRYGAKSNPYRRLALYSHHLAFSHPFTRKMLSFACPLPFPFAQLQLSDPVTERIHAMSSIFSACLRSPLKDGVKDF